MMGKKAKKVPTKQTGPPPKLPPKVTLPPAGGTVLGKNKEEPSSLSSSRSRGDTPLCFQCDLLNSIVDSTLVQLEEGKLSSHPNLHLILKELGNITMDLGGCCGRPFEDYTDSRSRSSSSTTGVFWEPQELNDHVEKEKQKLSTPKFQVAMNPELVPVSASSATEIGEVISNMKVIESKEEDEKKE